MPSISVRNIIPCPGRGPQAELRGFRITVAEQAAPVKKTLDIYNCPNRCEPDPAKLVAPLSGGRMP